MSILRSLLWYIYLYSFVLLGGLLFGCILVLPIKKAQKKTPLQNIARFWARSLVYISGSSVSLVGEKHLLKNKKYILCANHQSSFDIFILLGFLEQNVVFLSKPLYFKIPIFGWAMRILGHFPINRSRPKRAAADLASLNKNLAENISLAIFPEGTRSTDGKIAQFKSAWLRIVDTHTNLEIVPVSIINTMRILKKGELLIRPANVTIVFDKAIPYSAYSTYSTYSAQQTSTQKTSSAQQKDYKIIPESRQRRAFVQTLQDIVERNYRKYQK